MYVNELELGDSAYYDRVYVACPVQPGDELAHEDGYVLGSRRRVYRLACGGVDNVALHTPVLSRRGGFTADAGYQAPVYFEDESLGDWTTVVQIGTDEVEGVTIVEKLSGVVRVRPRNGAARQKVAGLIDRKPSSLDVRSMVRLEEESARAHRVDPLVRMSSRFEEAPGALDVSQCRGYCVGN